MLLDTHVWLAGAAGDARSAGARARRLLEAGGRSYLSAVSIFEAAALHVLGRIRLSHPIERWVRETIERGGLRVVDVDMPIAMDAGLIPISAVSDPIDRLLVATARALDVPIVTGDRRLVEYARATRTVRVTDTRR